MACWLPRSARFCSGAVAERHAVAAGQLREGLALGRLPVVELLQADDVGLLLAQKAGDRPLLPPHFGIVEAPDVVGEHLEGIAAVLLGLVGAAELGLVVEPQPEEPRHDADEQHSGASPPPADDPVEGQQHGGDVGQRRTQPQNREKPRARRVDVGRAQRQHHRHDGQIGQHRHHDIEQQHHRTAAAPLAAVAAPVFIVIFGHTTQG